MVLHPRGGTMPENVEQQLASLLQLSKPTLVEAWQQLFKKGPQRGQSSTPGLH
jgi:hypothetical protein